MSNSLDKNATIIVKSTRSKLDIRFCRQAPILQVAQASPNIPHTNENTVKEDNNRGNEGDKEVKAKQCTQILQKPLGQDGDHNRQTANSRSTRHTSTCSKKGRQSKVQKYWRKRLDKTAIMK